MGGGDAAPSPATRGLRLTRSTVVVYDYDKNRRGVISEELRHALEVHSKVE